MTGQVSEDRPIPAIPSEMESVEDTIRRLLPTPAPPAFCRRHRSIQTVTLLYATDGNDLPTNAGGTGTASNEQLRNAVIQWVPSGNSHGGGLHRGVLFMRRMDT